MQIKEHSLIAAICGHAFNFHPHGKSFRILVLRDAVSYRRLPSNRIHQFVSCSRGHFTVLHPTVLRHRLDLFLPFAVLISARTALHHFVTSSNYNCICRVLDVAGLRLFQAQIANSVEPYADRPAADLGWG
jgi:hypothetical protein